MIQLFRLIDISLLLGIKVFNPLNVRMGVSFSTWYEVCMDNVFDGMKALYREGSKV